MSRLPLPFCIASLAVLAVIGPAGAADMPGVIPAPRAAAAPSSGVIVQQAVPGEVVGGRIDLRAGVERAGHWRAAGLNPVPAEYQQRYFRSPLHRGWPHGLYRRWNDPYGNSYGSAYWGGGLGGGAVIAQAQAGTVVPGTVVPGAAPAPDPRRCWRETRSGPMVKGPPRPRTVTVCE